VDAAERHVLWCFVLQSVRTVASCSDGGWVLAVPVVVAVMKIKDDVVAGKRPATRLFLADVPDYVKEMTSQCWAQEPDHRPPFSGTARRHCYALDASQSANAFGSFYRLRVGNQDALLLPRKRPCMWNLDPTRA